MLARDGVDVEAVAHVLDQPHGIGAVVHGIAQNVQNVSVGVEFDGLEEGLVLLQVSVKVGNYVGHICVLSARARACPFVRAGIFILHYIILHRMKVVKGNFREEKREQMLQKCYRFFFFLLTNSALKGSTICMGVIPKLHPKERK